MSLALNIRKARPLAASALPLSLMLSVVPDAMSKEIVRSGTFYGQSDHVVTGKVTIEKDGDKTYVVLGPGFTLDGATAPTLGFGNGEKFDVKTEFTKLKSHSGAQRYEVPKNILVSAYDTFTVWCSKFSIPLGSAKLS